MGVGLSKNSPVQLSLSKGNYEALISRHGQWIRWRTASKCSCVQYGSMQPDIKCKICSGRGVTYSYQKNQMVTTISVLSNNDGILFVEEDYQDCELVEVYDYKGKRYDNAEKYGEYVHLNADKLPVKGTYFTIVLRQNNVKVLKKAIAHKTESGHYVIEELTVQKPNVEGIYYKSPADILSIESITDEDGNEYIADEFRLNQFIIKSEIQPETLIVQNVEYLPPFIFILLNQNLSKADAEMVTESHGDAVCTFPYPLDVSSDDVLTVLTGYYTNKEIMTKKEYEYDVIGAYFVYDIISCTGIVDGEIIEYKEGRDFVLVGTNKIKWLESAENIPDDGDAYSISYHVLPTYKVVKEIPQLRTSENQRFPKKCVVKLYSTYSDNIGVNKQVIGRKGYEGSY